MQYKGYVGRVEFDADEGIFHGEVEGVRDVITFEGTSVKELRQAFQDSINDYLEMCAERNEVPDKPYSGRVLLRIEPELHREAALAAANQGKSLNALAMEALSAWLDHFARQEPNRSKAAHVQAPRFSIADQLGQETKILYQAKSPADVMKTKLFTSITPSSETPGSNTPPLH